MLSLRASTLFWKLALAGVTDIRLGRPQSVYMYLPIVNAQGVMWGTHDDL